MSEKVQLKGGICEFDFGYNANTAVYPNSSSDITKLSAIPDPALSFIRATL
jgi:hypothetical protein